MIFEQRMIDGECTMIMGTASLVNAPVHSPKTTGFYNVYERHESGRYDTWRAFTNTFYAENAKRWHEGTGEFWGGIMQRYTEQGTWPKIRDLLQTGVVHRFTPIPEDDEVNWGRPVSGSPLTLRLPSALRFRGYGQFQMGQISGKSTGVVDLQDQVASRPTELRQCSDSVGRGSTRR
jgi:hypothetical protein